VLYDGVWSWLFDQAEPPGYVASCRRLQEEGTDDRDQGDRDLGSLDAAGQEYARHCCRDDPRVAAPAEEGYLVARPLATSVRQQAGKDVRMLPTIKAITKAVR
jgi:hypothetical protein